MTSRAISREGGGPCRFFRCSREAGNESRLSVYRSRNLSRQQTILLFAHCAANRIEPERHGFRRSNGTALAIAA